MGVWYRLGRGLGALSLMWACAATGQTPSLTLIAPPAGRTQTAVSAISAVGRFVTGFTTDSGSARRGFTWSRETGVIEWGSMPNIPFPSLPSGISNDGSTVVGTTGTLNT